MDKKYNLSFIISRVKEIGSALMHDLDYEHHPERLPANIVTVLKADEEGSLWFFIRKPIAADDRPLSFPATLQFLRKGKNFFIRVNGTAREAEMENPVHSTMAADKTISPDALSQLTLIEMKINEVEYREYDNPKSEQGFWARLEHIYRHVFNLPAYTRQWLTQLNIKHSI